jgi:hypothetical protein
MADGTENNALSSDNVNNYADHDNQNQGASEGGDEIEEGNDRGKHSFAARI